MKTAQVAIDYPAVVAGIAAALGATCHDRAPHRHPNNAPPEHYRRYLQLPDGIVIEAHWYAEPRGTWIDFSWANYPMDGNTYILPREAATLASGEAPDTYTRANAGRPPAAIAAQVARKVLEPARRWLPVMQAFIARRQAADKLALDTAWEIHRAFGTRFDPERDRRGHASYQVWLSDAPFGFATINGFGTIPEPSVSIYVERCSDLSLRQLTAMVGAWRAHKEAGHD